ncbi:hypothetical protein [Chelativorans sp. M5D2P16]|uniref:hypothetical protein n=1 Tax=Chelativorans sp. M5D2P16 TaxID=3095678 RepID=UPI002ACAC6FD|nr:hypothetical protein [Chelativorans sp. M5D2P16]MDZ5698331.1 hypothetical protein [Chelativorans sp. M5D2P16]
MLTRCFTAICLGTSLMGMAAAIFAAQAGRHGAPGMEAFPCNVEQGIRCPSQEAPGPAYRGGNHD